MSTEASQGDAEQKAQEDTGLRNTNRGTRSFNGSIFWEIIWRENCVSRLTRQ